MASCFASSNSTPSSHILLSSCTSSASSNLSPIQLQFPCFRFQSKIKICAIAPATKRRFHTKIRSVAEEEETLVSEAEASPPPADATTEQTVSVPVSPSDVLTMFFLAEGSMTDAAIPTVTKALEDIEGVTNLEVGVLEGIASVKLTKQTTVQATGVASSLVEIIQGSGFKLQTLNLSFQDEEDFS
ncbi:uncharacterized protein LOC111382218 [Olea europaea var. sylvestris]|uniref:uncharacterized protein LOC111382218 n=1 Tax=Olea europaea var. sylvestris TaxID=158386 RepID=UPI000C1D6EE9|nr:uncharacterized protein LOC111382218 [Olea europaea var. sylvestris]